MYKDLVLPLQKDCLPSSSQLKAKGELSFEHHARLEGCRREGLHHCTRYGEMHPFCAGHRLVLFFLARLLPVCGGHRGANAAGRASPGRAGPQLLPLRPLSGWPGLPRGATRKTCRTRSGAWTGCCPRTAAWCGTPSCQELQWSLGTSSLLRTDLRHAPAGRCSGGQLLQRCGGRRAWLRRAGPPCPLPTRGEAPTGMSTPTCTCSTCCWRTWPMPGPCTCPLLPHGQVDQGGPHVGNSGPCG